MKHVGRLVSELRRRKRYWQWRQRLSARAARMSRTKRMSSAYF